jgi:hypothetical protein
MVSLAVQLSDADEPGSVPIVTCPECHASTYVGPGFAYPQECAICGTPLRPGRARKAPPAEPRKGQQASGPDSDESRRTTRLEPS